MHTEEAFLMNTYMYSMFSLRNNKIIYLQLSSFIRVFRKTLYCRIYKLNEYSDETVCMYRLI